MPIYEYRCKNCGHELEALQKISDDELTQCPGCEQPELQKLMSAAGFRLKGSGWYETDFKSGNQRNLHESGDKKDSGEKKGKDSAKDSKGADKKDGQSKADNKKPGTGKSSKPNKNKPASAA